MWHPTGYKGMSIAQRKTGGVAKANARTALLARGVQARAAAVQKFRGPYPFLNPTRAGMQRAMAMQISPGPGARGPVEVKSYDYAPADASTITNQTPPAGNAGNNLAIGWGCVNCGIQQGATFYNRVGTKIIMKSVRVRFTLNNPVAQQTGTTPVRWMVFYDRQPNGAYPAFLDLLQINDSGVTDFNGPLNIQNRSRFTVLRDQIILLTPYSPGAVVDSFINMHMEAEYGTNTGLIGDVRTGAVHFLLFTNNHGNVHQPDLYDIQVRTRYLD